MDQLFSSRTSTRNDNKNDNMVCYHILLHPRALLRLGLLKLTFLSFSILLLYHLHHTSQATLSLTAKPNLTTPGPRNLTAELENKNLNWDQYKYVQVVSTADELCSAVMIWNQIEGVGSRAGRFVSLSFSPAIILWEYGWS